MYLTRVRLSNFELAALQGGDTYRWHQLLCKSFNQTREEAEYLFRADLKKTGVEILMQSPVEPEAQDWGVWETKRIPDNYLSFKHYKFRLKLCSDVREDNKTVRTVSDPQEAYEWLAYHQEKCGFKILNLVSTSNKVYSMMEDKMIQHGCLDYSGLLEVTDIEKFKNTVLKGIGRAKAFGFGLLSLNPA